MVYVWVAAAEPVLFTDAGAPNKRPKIHGELNTKSTDIEPFCLP